MGLIGHEAPRLVTGGPIAYAGVHGHRPLEANMVLSVETSISHPVGGYVKLEDTVIVTADGCEGVGDYARGWTIVE
jgi:Xaa-Pro aminopeptidase